MEMRCFAKIFVVGTMIQISSHIKGLKLKPIAWRVPRDMQEWAFETEFSFMGKVEFEMKLNDMAYWRVPLV